MDKLFRYSVMAVEHPDQEVCHEVSFEKNAILRKDDVLDLEIGEQTIRVKIASVRKVDHITTPNDQFHYRLFAVAF